MSSYVKQEGACRKERSVICKEEYVGGRAAVTTTDEEQVL